MVFGKVPLCIANTSSVQFQEAIWWTTFEKLLWGKLGEHFFFIIMRYSLSLFPKH